MVGFLPATSVPHRPAVGARARNPDGGDAPAMRDLSSHADLEQLGRQLEPMPSPAELRAMPTSELFQTVFAGAGARNRRREQLLAQSRKPES